MNKGVIAAAVAASLSWGAAAQAGTVDIIGGDTDVLVTADLAGLGLTGAPTGTAEVELVIDFAQFTFGITGGSVDEVGNALIEHDGSGVSLTGGGTTATVGDFLIDTEAANITGTVNDALFGVELFTFGTVSAEGIQLLISDSLAGALTSVFGVGSLAGAEFGLANTNPITDVAPVPLPAGGLLLITALGGLAYTRRKRAA